MKRAILSLLILVLFCTCIHAGEDKGLTFWGLNEKSFDSESSVVGRLGYAMDDFLLKDEDASIEIFIGTTWIPETNGETGKIDPPTTLSLGGLYFLPDIIDSDSPIPWIPDLLLTVLPEKAEAKPYIGGQATFNLIDNDAGLLGGIVGIKAKTQPDALWDLIFEADYNNFIYDLSTLPYDDEFVYTAGIRIGF